MTLAFRIARMVAVQVLTAALLAPPSMATSLAFQSFETQLPFQAGEAQLSTAAKAKLQDTLDAIRTSDPCWVEVIFIEAIVEPKAAGDLAPRVLAVQREVNVRDYLQELLIPASVMYLVVSTTGSGFSHTQESGLSGVALEVLGRVSHPSCKRPLHPSGLRFLE